MDISKNTLLGTIAVLIVVVGFIAFKSPPEIQPIINVNPVINIPEAKTPDLGAFPGTDFQSSSITFNGITHFYERVGMTNATGTTCRIRAPRASTTLIRATANLSVMSTSSRWRLGWYNSNTGFSTTTGSGQIGGYVSFASASQGVFNASTTVTSPLAQSDPVKFYATSSYLTLDVHGTVGTTSPVGFCSPELVRN